MVERGVLVDIDKYERKAGEKLKKDFAREIDALEDGLQGLAICINQEMLAKPELVRELATKDYRELSPEAVGFFVCSLLLSEALTRLFAARRLFLSGYMSRALASTRDALESAMTANVCKNDEKLCMRWLRGQVVKLTKGLKYDRALSWKSWNISQGILNPLGTHSYALATVLSSSVYRAMQFPKNDEMQRMYVHDAKFVLWRMLGRCYQMLLFIKRNYPEAKKRVGNFDKLLLSIMEVAGKELQLTLDEELIKRETGNTRKRSDRCD